MNLKETLRGRVFGTKARTKDLTLEVDGIETDFVLVAPSEPKLQEFVDIANAEDTTSEQELRAAARLVCIMVHVPKADPEGDVIRNARGKLIPAEPLFDEGSPEKGDPGDVPMLMDRPFGDVTHDMRDACSEFIQELRLGKSKKTASSGTSSESPNDSDSAPSGSSR